MRTLSQLGGLQGPEKNKYVMIKQVSIFKGGIADFKVALTLITDELL